MRQWRRSTFFPCRLRRHSSRNKKVAWLLSSAALRPASRCRVDRLRPVDRHRGRNGAGSEQSSRRTIMATIGTFKKSGTNEFTGKIVTLSVQAKNVRIAPEAHPNGQNAHSHPHQKK